jgi:hypothetical protein
MTIFQKLKAALLGAGLSELQPSDLKPGLRFNNFRSPEGPHVVIFDRLIERKDGAHVLVLELYGSGPDSIQRLTIALDAIEQNKDAIAEVWTTEADFSVLDLTFARFSASHQNAFQRTDIILKDVPA